MSAKCKYAFRKKDFLDGGIITGIILAIALVLLLVGIGTQVFDPVGQALKNYHLSDGFFYTRASRSGKLPELNPDVCLVDIGGCDSREEIAGIVNRINEAAPRLLAVDIIFGKAASMTPEGDSALVSAFRASDRLVLARRFDEGPDGWVVERSFFADELDCVEGDVDFDYGIVRSFSPTVTIDGQEYPTFVGQIARLGGIRETFRRQLINFTPVSTPCLTPDQLSAAELLKDRIVILGDRGDYRDFHDIPVLMEGRPRTSGMDINAQCLFTLSPKKGFTDCPEWLSVLIGLVLTYLFCTFIASPMSRLERFSGLWISIWQVAVLILLLALTFFLFWGLRFNMPLKYWLLGVGFSGLATELFGFICKKREK